MVACFHKGRRFLCIPKKLKNKRKREEKKVRKKKHNSDIFDNVIMKVCQTVMRMVPSE